MREGQLAKGSERCGGGFDRSEMMAGIFQTCDVVLAARINSLVKNGVLEFRGKSPFAIRFSEIRLPRSRG
jgi:hypothetical protein